MSVEIEISNEEPKKKNPWVAILITMLIGLFFSSYMTIWWNSIEIKSKLWTIGNDFRESLFEIHRLKKEIVILNEKLDNLSQTP